MTLLFISPIPEHVYSGYENVKLAARRNSGCKIVVLDNGAGSGPRDKEFCEASSKRLKRERLDIQAIRRHYIALDYIESHKLRPPFVIPDWDFLIFQNLNEALEPYRSNDYCNFVYPMGRTMPASVHFNVEPLVAFCDNTLRLTRELPDMDYAVVEDMYLWKVIGKTGRFKVGNLLEEHNGAVFDGGMHQVEPEFTIYGYTADSDGYKQLYRYDRKPAFKKLDGEFVLANWIHCWGKYKPMTGELLTQFV